MYRNIAVLWDLADPPNVIIVSILHHFHLIKAHLMTLFPRSVPSVANNVRGMVFMLVSTVGFAGMVMLVRAASKDIHAFEIAFFRNLFGLLVLVPWFMQNQSQDRLLME